jgi:uncharacterized protein YukE
LVLVKCQQYQKWFTKWIQSLSNTNDILHRAKDNNPKFHMEVQKTLESQNNL